MSKRSRKSCTKMPWFTLVLAIFQTASKNLWKLEGDSFKRRAGAAKWQIAVFTTSIFSEVQFACMIFRTCWTITKGKKGGGIIKVKTDGYIAAKRGAKWPDWKHVSAKFMNEFQALWEFSLSRIQFLSFLARAFENKAKHSIFLSLLSRGESEIWFENWPYSCWSHAWKINLAKSILTSYTVVF